MALTPRPTPLGMLGAVATLCAFAAASTWLLAPSRVCGPISRLRLASSAPQVARRRHVVVVSVGGCVGGLLPVHVDAYLRSATRTYSTVVVDWSDSGSPGCDASAADISVRLPGAFKFDGLYTLFATMHPELLSEHDHFALFDEDAGFRSPADVDRLLHLASSGGFSIAQASLSLGSVHSHPVVLHVPEVIQRGAVGRRTRYVEIAMPVFSRDELLRWLPQFRGTTTGWCLDVKWSLAALRNETTRLAIFDVVQVDHLRPMASDGPIYRRIGGLQKARDEVHACVAAHEGVQHYSDVMPIVDGIRKGFNPPPSLVYLPEPGALVATPRSPLPVHIYLISRNEGVLLPHTLAHYKSRFPDATITVFDNDSTDDTRKLALAAGCRVESFSTGFELNDTHHQHLKNTAWLGDAPSWVIFADADEWLDMSASALRREDAAGTTVVLTVGVEVVKNSTWADLRDVDLHESPRRGYRNRMYSKLVAFKAAPPAVGVAYMNYSIGGHVATPTGRVVFSRRCFSVLHMNFLGAPYLAQKYASRFARTHSARLHNHSMQYTTDVRVVEARSQRALAAATAVSPGIGEFACEVITAFPFPESSGGGRRWAPFARTAAALSVNASTSCQRPFPFLPDSVGARGFDIPGQNLTAAPEATPSAAACCALCADQGTRCVAWVWRIDSRLCDMKSSGVATRSSDNFVSGVVAI